MTGVKTSKSSSTTIFSKSLQAHTLASRKRLTRRSRDFGDFCPSTSARRCRADRYQSASGLNGRCVPPNLYHRVTFGRRRRSVTGVVITGGHSTSGQVAHCLHPRGVTHRNTARRLKPPLTDSSFTIDFLFVERRFPSHRVLFFAIRPSNVPCLADNVAERFRHSRLSVLCSVRFSV